jgi:hypothetical protein
MSRSSRPIAATLRIVLCAASAIVGVPSIAVPDADVTNQSSSFEPASDGSKTDPQGARGYSDKLARIKAANKIGSSEFRCRGRRSRLTGRRPMAAACRCWTCMKAFASWSCPSRAPRATVEPSAIPIREHSDGQASKLALRSA